ncbi:hypothetical protein BpHYR1_035703 [Brachionus plicatilis]|uniref:C2H2-type domain-containing protein n=1 Tax=Brachionus plicatilis TaxID=10195 RepID=A0A3M7Q1N3_BRAPC|nr:hypothetical protein BpHYR1_035703 [Brachionus plicatilis]
MKHNEQEVDLNSSVFEHEVQTEALGVVGEPNNEDSEWADANDEANDERQCQFCNRLFKSKQGVLQHQTLSSCGSSSYSSSSLLVLIFSYMVGGFILG